MKIKILTLDIFLCIIILNFSCQSQSIEKTSTQIKGVFVNPSITDSIESKSMSYLGFGFTRFDYILSVNDSITENTFTDDYPSLGRCLMVSSNDTVRLSGETRSHDPIEYQITITKSNAKVMFSIVPREGELVCNTKSGKFSRYLELEVPVYEILINQFPTFKKKERICGRISFTSPRYFIQIADKVFSGTAQVDALFDSKTLINE